MEEVFLGKALVKNVLQDVAFVGDKGDQVDLLITGEFAECVLLPVIVKGMEGNPSFKIFYGRIAG